MQYSTPELIVLGPTSVVVQGIPDGFFDSMISTMSRPHAGVAFGLDD